MRLRSEGSLYNIMQDHSWENFTGKCQKRDIIMGAQTKTMPELVD